MFRVVQVTPQMETSGNEVRGKGEQRPLWISFTGPHLVHNTNWPTFFVVSSNVCISLMFLVHIIHCKNAVLSLFSCPRPCSCYLVGTCQATAAAALCSRPRKSITLIIRAARRNDRRLLNNPATRQLARHSGWTPFHCVTSTMNLIDSPSRVTVALWWPARPSRIKSMSATVSREALEYLGF